MANIGTLIDFTGGNVLYAAQLDSNFSDIRTVVNGQVVHTDKASQVVTKTLTFTPDAGAAITVSTGGITITAGGLTVTAGGATITAGNLAVTAGNLTFGAASAKVIPGATSLLFRDNADANTNLSITDAGAVAIRAGLTVGGAVTGITTLAMSSTLTLSASASKIVPGATSLSLRNNADNADNVLVTDAGVVTVRSHLNVTGAIGGNASSAVSISATTLAITNNSGLIVIGSGSALATSATTGGILQIARCAGVPSGAVNDGAMMLDTTNNRIYFRSNATWKYAALT